MTDFGTMSVTRSLSISTRNSSTSAGVPHFQSGFGAYYGALHIKEHDLTSVTYPGFYGNRHADFFPSQSVSNGLSSSPMMSMVPPNITCHQQQFQQQQQQQLNPPPPPHHQLHHKQQQLNDQQHQQQHRRRSEWITLSKPFLLKLVEKLCQLSFETEPVSSSAPEVIGQGHVEPTNCRSTSVNNHNNTLTAPIAVCSQEINYVNSGNATTTSMIDNQTSNNNNINNNGSRKSRLKSRPMKFVRPFESSEERQKSDESDNINVESDNEDSTTNNNTSSPPNVSNIIVSSNPSLPETKIVVDVVVEKTLKRERELGDDSDTEHINVEDDDDNDDDKDMTTTAKQLSMETHGKISPALDRSKSFHPTNFDPPATGQMFNPMWSEYIKFNYNLQPTYQSAFNTHKVTSGLTEEQGRQSWAAFNKSLVYKMFDDVLDSDKMQTSSAYPNSQSALHGARFLFANHRSNPLSLHLSNALDKHLGYDIAFHQARIGSKGNQENERSNGRRSTLVQSRNKRLRDAFMRGRHQLINKRNRLRYADSGSTPVIKKPTNEMSELKNSNKDLNPVCDVPILGALLRSNDNKIYSNNRTSQHINNINKIGKTKTEQLQQNNSISKTTANNTISHDVPPKNGFRQNPSKIDGWPKWVALDKGQVRSLVDSLVATMMGNNQSPISSSSLSPQKSHDDDTEMQVDSSYHDNTSSHVTTTNNRKNNKNVINYDDSNHHNNANDSNVNCSNQSEPSKVEFIEAESSCTHNDSNRDSETETNFSGDTQLDQSDLDECSRHETSDDGAVSLKDGGDDADDCTRMECHSTHHQCPIKWKSNMLRRMKAEKRKPEKES